MIIDTVKQALQDIFPEPEPLIEEPAASRETAEETPGDSKKKSKEKEEPRANGVLEREHAQCGYDLDVQLEPGELLATVMILDKADFFLESITGVDWIKENQLEVVYDFSRYDFEVCRVVLRTRTPRSEPVVPTISKIYPGASWHERESHDFFGIKFDGHPHLVPLLLPEDADFHPLLKDFNQ